MRRHPRRAPAADAARLDRGVRRRHPQPHGRRPTSPLVAVDPDLAPFIEAAARRPADGARSTELRRRRRRTSCGPTYDPDAVAVLQFTSGSTAEPKGVVLPNRTICANLDAVAAGAGLDPDHDVLVSWLPLYHDMGLVGFLMLPLTTGTPLVLGAPQDFLAAPLRVDGVAVEVRRHGDRRSELLLRARHPGAAQRAAGLDLSSLRVALNGAEPVDPDSVEAFVAEAAPPRHGPRRGVPRLRHGRGDDRRRVPGARPRPAHRPRRPPGARDRALRRARRRRRRRVAPRWRSSAGRCRASSSASAIPRPASCAAGREVGELQIRGTSVTPGYYRAPEATAELFVDGGWLRTGDLAYLLDGELVVCGRIKDVIIVGGRNVFPEDVEKAVADVDGVRAGNVIAFGIEGRRGKEGLIVVAESKTDDVEACRRSVAERVREAVGLPAKEVVLVAAGTLPKTSSGKLQRSLCKQRYLDEALTRA